MIGDRKVNVFFDDVMLGHDPQVDLPFMPSRVEKRVSTVLQSLNFKWSYPEHPGRLSAIKITWMRTRYQVSALPLVPLPPMTS